MLLRLRELLLCLLLFSGSSLVPDLSLHAQNPDRPESEEEMAAWGPRWQFGFGGGPVVAITEANMVNSTIGMRGLVRYSLTPSIALELGGGFLHYVDRHSEPRLLDVEGDAYPLDLRFLWIPHRGSFLTPYLFGGAGISYFNADFPSTYLSPYHEHGPLSGIFAHLPVGAGLLIGTGISGIEIDLQTTLNFGLTDDLNPNRDGQIDNLWQAQIGPTFSFGSLAPAPPVDSDNDGVSDDLEILRGTDPERRDSDGDGIDDGTEINLFHTDPMSLDSDNDRLGDEEEIRLYRTDPTSADTDGDGLEDGDEVKLHRTNPLSIDSDGDGLGDWEELNTWHTNPVMVDTDYDNVTDGAEVQIHGTNPNNVDTDGGGVNDGDELERGTDPLNPDDG